MESPILIIFLLALTSAVHLTLGFIVYRKNPRALLNKMFFGLTSNISLWTLAVLVIIMQSDYRSVLFSVRLSHAVAAIIPWFVLALSYCFPTETNYPKKKIMLLLPLCLVFSVLSFTDLFIADVIDPGFSKEPVYGQLFPMYALPFAFTIIFALLRLFRQLRLSRGLARNQIRYFIGGTLLSLILASMANLFLPYWGVSAVDLRPFGPVFTLTMVISISYAIVKFRLMDIRLAFRKILINVFTIFLVAAAVFLFLLMIELIFNVNLDVSILTLAVLAAFTAFMFQPARKWAQQVVDKYFYESFSDYFNTFIETSKAMVSILQMQDLADFLVKMFVETVGVEGAFLSLKEDDGSFNVISSKKLNIGEETRGVIKKGSPLLSFLEGKEEVMLQTDFLHSSDSLEKDVSAAMSSMGIEVVVPVMMDGALEGVFGLGGKRSGEAYTREDVSLLSALASQLAVAIKNARLYQEVLELEREKSQAQRLAALGELAAGLAHEIKNPLVSIKTFAELLPEKYDDEEFRHHFSLIVAGEIERINSLIAELFNFAREPRWEITEINLQSLIEEVLVLLTPQCSSQNIRIIKTYPRRCPLLRGDRSQLKQAFLNICINGMQAMPEGGILRVDVLSIKNPSLSRREGDRDVSFPEGKIRIRIEDTGTGINPDMQDKIFDPFYSTKADGSGLGLSISHRIISNHGGSVYCHSKEGEGTLLEVVLPVSETQELEPAEEEEKKIEREGKGAKR